MTEQFTPTHTADGVPVMVCERDRLSAGDVDGHPNADLLVGSVGAYTEDEWNAEGEWPQVRVLADGSWARFDGARVVAVRALPA